MSALDRLPDKILLTVFHFAGPRAVLLSAQPACRRFRALARALLVRHGRVGVAISTRVVHYLDEHEQGHGPAVALGEWKEGLIAFRSFAALTEAQFGVNGARLAFEVQVFVPRKVLWA